MTDSRANANLAKPQAFETKNLPHGYAPAATPEFHQQTRDPGYANSPGEEGDGGGEEWATSDAAAGKFGSDTGDSGSTATEKPASSGGSSRTSKAASSSTK